MKRLQSCENQEYSLEVIECTCGFHIGFDATFIDQVGDFAFDCPSCGRCIETTKLFPEVDDDDENGVFNSTNENASNLALDHINKIRKKRSEHILNMRKNKK
jgi:hypothetical protein